MLLVYSENNMENKLNGQALDLTETFIDKDMREKIAAVDDEQKREYMERIWNMPKEQIFHELMRVHAEAGLLLTDAYAEIEKLKGNVH